MVQQKVIEIAALCENMADGPTRSSIHFRDPSSRNDSVQNGNDILVVHLLAWLPKRARYK
jgi:hypothetical protein